MVDFKLNADALITLLRTWPEHHLLACSVLVLSLAILILIWRSKK